MNAYVIAVVLCVVPALALLAPLAWRAFIRGADEAIENEMNNLRDRGFFGGKYRRR